MRTDNNVQGLLKTPRYDDPAKSEQNINILGSTLTGVQAGAQFGLPGAIAGGFLGLGMGVEQNQKAKSEIALRNESIDNQNRFVDTMNNRTTVRQYASPLQARYGIKNKQGDLDVEVQTNEVKIGADGSVKTIYKNAAKHDDPTKPKTVTTLKKGEKIVPTNTEDELSSFLRMHSRATMGNKVAKTQLKRAYEDLPTPEEAMGEQEVETYHNLKAYDGMDNEYNTRNLNATANMQLDTLLKQDVAQETTEVPEVTTPKTGEPSKNLSTMPGPVSVPFGDNSEGMENSDDTQRKDFETYNNPLKYANMAYNFYRGSQPADKQTRRYDTFDPMQYRDTSAQARQDVRLSRRQLAESTRGKGMSTGQMTAVASQFAKHGHGAMDAINARESQLAFETNRHNVGMSNQSRAQNTAAARQYDMMDKQAEAAKRNFTAAGFNEMARHADVFENRKYATQRDQRQFDMEDNYLQSLSGTNFKWEKDSKTGKMKYIETFK